MGIRLSPRLLREPQLRAVQLRRRRFLLRRLRHALLRSRPRHIERRHHRHRRRRQAGLDGQLMLRPLWLTENYPPDRGGMAQSCDRIVHALRTRGVTVDVAHVSRRHADWRVETKIRGKQISCPAAEDPSHTLNRLWNLISHCAADEAPTHVVAFGGTLPLLAGPPYAAWLGLPLLTLIRGNDFDAAIFSPKKSD